jgi:hypothetical protein
MKVLVFVVVGMELKDAAQQRLAWGPGRLLGMGSAVAACTIQH